MQVLEQLYLYGRTQLLIASWAQIAGFRREVYVIDLTCVGWVVMIRFFWIVEVGREKWFFEDKQWALERMGYSGNYD